MAKFNKGDKVRVAESIKEFPFAELVGAQGTVIAEVPEPDFFRADRGATKFLVKLEGIRETYFLEEHFLQAA